MRWLSDFRTAIVIDLSTGRGRDMNKRYECRGRTARTHDLHVRIGQSGRKRQEHGHPPCHQVSWNRERWSCGHEEFCDQCGKIMRWFLPRYECPLYGSKRQAGETRVNEFTNGA